jgi:hypothetical protein
VWLALLASMIPARSAEVYQAAAVKAAFLYRFTGYVNWPAAASTNEGFTIAVLGSPRVGQALQQLLNGRTIKDRTARVQQIDSVGAMRDAQVLYIGKAFNGNLSATVAQLAGRPILVVTDDPDGLDAGSVINFLVANRRVRFEISLPAAEQAGLKISSELLGVAARVRGAPKKQLEPHDDTKQSGPS